MQSVGSNERGHGRVTGILTFLLVATGALIGFILAIALMPQVTVLWGFACLVAFLGTLVMIVAFQSPWGTDLKGGLVPAKSWHPMFSWLAVFSTLAMPSIYLAAAALTDLVWAYAVALLTYLVSTHTVLEYFGLWRERGVTSRDRNGRFSVLGTALPATAVATTAVHLSGIGWPIVLVGAMSAAVSVGISTYLLVTVLALHAMVDLPDRVDAIEARLDRISQSERLGRDDSNC